MLWFWALFDWPVGGGHEPIKIFYFLSVLVGCLVSCSCAMVNGVKIYALDQLICLVVLGFMCLAGGLWPLANRNILLF